MALKKALTLSVQHRQTTGKYPMAHPMAYLGYRLPWDKPRAAGRQGVV